MLRVADSRLEVDELDQGSKTSEASGFELGDRVCPAGLAYPERMPVAEGLDTVGEETTRCDAWVSVSLMNTWGV